MLVAVAKAREVWAGQSTWSEPVVATDVAIFFNLFHIITMWSCSVCNAMTRCRWYKWKNLVTTCLNFSREFMWENVFFFPGLPLGQMSYSLCTLSVLCCVVCALLWQDDNRSYSPVVCACPKRNQSTHQLVHQLWKYVALLISNINKIGYILETNSFKGNAIVFSPAWVLGWQVWRLQSRWLILANIRRWILCQIGLSMTAMLVLGTSEPHWCFSCPVPKPADDADCAKAVGGDRCYLSRLFFSSRLHPVIKQ